METFLRHLKKFLASWLPTKLSQGTMGLSLMIVLALLTLRSWLTQLGWNIPLETIKLIQQILIPSTLILGTLLTLHLVVRHSKRLQDAHNKEILELKESFESEKEHFTKQDEPKKDKISNLSEKTISVLSEIANYENYLRTHTSDKYCIIDELAMSKLLKLSPQKFKYHLEQLSSANCIEQ